MTWSVGVESAFAGMRAKWIAPRGSKGLNYTFLARKEFLLHAIPPGATLRIAADSRYVVYVNGELVGVGPARGTHKRYFVDSYDVGRLLRAGKNHIAVEVHCPNKAFFSVVPSTPALLAEIEGVVATDETWETIADPSRRSDAPEYTMQMGFSECRDLRKEPAGWQVFKDSRVQWLPAEVVSEAASLGGRALAPRDISPLTETLHAPERVVKTGCVGRHREDVEEDLDYAALMRMENHFEALLPRFENAEGIVHGGVATIIPSKSHARGAFCLLDFCRELHGSVVIDVEAPEGTILDVGYDEDAAQGRLLTKSAATPHHDYRFADRYILREGRQRIEHRLHDRGLRFLQLVFRRFDRPIRLHAVKVVHRVYPLQREATFECNDPFLNRLWAMCCDTVSLCSTDTFIDCPWREQSFWLNDQLVMNLYYLNLTSDPGLAKRCLRVGADGALPDGLIPAVYPSGRTCLFSSLPAIWAIVLSDYFQYTGDRAFLREMLPVMNRALDIYSGWRDGEGLVATPENLSTFIDWGYQNADVEPGRRTAVLNILVAAGCKRAAVLQSAAGDADSALASERLSRATMEAVLRRFWRGDSQRFDDEPVPGADATFSQHTHALALHFGLLDAPQRPAAANAMMNPSAVQAELYFQHFVLGALARNGRAGDAMRVVRDLWGGMVRAGSPTVWESVRGRDAFSGCGSLCHGFSCAPLHFMQGVILGVRPLKPGFEEFTFEPHRVGLSHACGDVPTPKGLIHIAWKTEHDGISSEIRVPEGTVARLADGGKLAGGRHTVRLENADT